MSRRTRQILAGVLVSIAAISTPARAADPPARADASTMTWALHFTLAPTLFEPAETVGLITPFMLLYALHDALVKPMPGKVMAPSLAESWTTSPDGLVQSSSCARA
jgi:peptide/nickel transport system substrate-binding protein